jgi:hypothetical protein
VVAQPGTAQAWKPMRFLKACGRKAFPDSFFASQKNPKQTLCLPGPIQNVNFGLDLEKTFFLNGKKERFCRKQKAGGIQRSWGKHPGQESPGHGVVSSSERSRGTGFRNINSGLSWPRRFLSLSSNLFKQQFYFISHVHQTAEETIP